MRADDNLGEQDWPWAPATAIQGFLAGRWQRRDGTIYDPTYTPPVPPQVLSGNFRLIVPPNVGDVVGTCGFIGQVTGWSIVAGNGDGYWAISSRGVITVAATGMFEGVIYEISVTANDRGAESAPAEMFILTVAGLRGGESESKVSSRVQTSGTPIAGGPDFQAKVYVPSGVPRSG